MTFFFEFPNLFHGIDFEFYFYIADAAIPISAQGHKLSFFYTFVNFQPTSMIVNVEPYLSIPITLAH